MTELKSYYVDLEDGYELGDLYYHNNEAYEVVRIEGWNQLMEVQEIEPNV